MTLWWGRPPVSMTVNLRRAMSGPSGSMSRWVSVPETSCNVLFADDAGEPDHTRYRDDAFGFYSTEGLRGLGWAEDAVPTLKGGSTIGHPTPAAQTDGDRGTAVAPP